MRWTCLGDFPFWADTIVRWDLEPAASGTGSTVVFRQEGWPSEYPELEYAKVNYSDEQGREAHCTERGDRDRVVIRLIAAHSWDIAGAMRAGAAATFGLVRGWSSIRWGRGRTSSDPILTGSPTTS